MLVEIAGLDGDAAGSGVLHEPWKKPATRNREVWCYQTLMTTERSKLSPAGVQRTLTLPIGRTLRFLATLKAEPEA